MLDKIIDAIVWMYKAIAVATLVLVNVMVLLIPWVIACANELTVGSAIVCVAFDLLWLIFTAGYFLEE